MLIGLAGRAGVGKSSAANWLRHARGFRCMAFADPIKDALGTIYDVDIKTLEATHSKDDIIPGIGTSLRELYQTLGTDWGREMIDKKLWVRLAARKIDTLTGRDICMTDVRFDNEADFIRRRGGVIICLFRPGVQSTRQHCSEQGFTPRCEDHLIVNNRSLAGLFDNLDGVLKFIGSGNRAGTARQAG